MFVMMHGMSIGVNMLKADPRLWVPVSTDYAGFAYKPAKGWLGRAVTQDQKRVSGGHINQRKSALSRNTKTSIDVRA